MNTHKLPFLIIALLISVASFAQTDTTQKPPQGNGPNMGTASDKSDSISSQDKTGDRQVDKMVKPAPKENKTNSSATKTKPAKQNTTTAAKPLKTKSAAKQTSANTTVKKDHTAVPAKDTSKTATKPKVAPNSGQTKSKAKGTATQHKKVVTNTTKQDAPSKGPKPKPAKKDSTHPDGNGPNAGTVH